MQFIKQLGKQLSFVVLIGCAVFSASSANAQIPVQVSQNTDVLFDPEPIRDVFKKSFDKSKLGIPKPDTVNLTLLGGVHFVEIDRMLNPNFKLKDDIQFISRDDLYNPFQNSYGNLRPVGGEFDEKKIFQDKDDKDIDGVSGILIRGSYIATKPLTLGLIPDPKSENPPFLKSGRVTGDGTTCDYTSCVVLHYGYRINLDSAITLNPKFLYSTYTLEAGGLTPLRFTQKLGMASPQVDLDRPIVAKQLLEKGQPKLQATQQEQRDFVRSNFNSQFSRSILNKNQFLIASASLNSLFPLLVLGLDKIASLPTQLSQATPTKYLVVYSEQTNPQQPGVTTINWTQFPFQGQTPKVSFTNSASNPDVKISNPLARESDKETPLNELTSKGLPPSTPGFVPIPGADGILKSGQKTTPVNIPTVTVDVPPTPPVDVPPTPTGGGSGGSGCSGGSGGLKGLGGLKSLGGSGFEFQKVPVTRVGTQAGGKLFVQSLGFTFQKVPVTLYGGCCPKGTIQGILNGDTLSIVYSTLETKATRPKVISASCNLRIPLNIERKYGNKSGLCEAPETTKNRDHTMTNLYSA